MSQEVMDPEVRRRVEDRFRDVTWRIVVCAEPDGDHCGSGTAGAGYHECAAGIRFRRGEGPAPRIAWVEVEPVKGSPER